MNPLNLLPWWAKLLILAAIASAVVGAVAAYNHHQRDIGREEVRAEWDAEKAKQVADLAAFNQESRRIEQRRQSTTTEAANAAQKQTQLARKDAADARAAVDGVRYDLAASRARLAGATEAARAKYSAALDTVFADCTRRYSEMAEAAQGHAIDSLMFQQAWPK